MKKIKTCIYWVLSVTETVFLTLVVILAIINLSMFVQHTILKKAVPTFMGYSYVNILSGSMEPTLSVGDLAICKVQKSYQQGDAILFETEKSLVLHRIVDEPKPNMYITQGDANNTEDDEAVPLSNIHGRLVCSIDGFGNVITFVSSKTGAFWAVLAALFIFLALDMGRDLVHDTTATKNCRET